MTNIDELRAAKFKLERIEALREIHRKHSERLALVNKHVKEGKVWTPTLTIRRGERYGLDEITIDLPIPSAWVQQRAVDLVKQAELALRMEGVDAS